MEGEKRLRSEHTRQAILHAAKALFIQYGYNGTSMRRIARKAGVALGGIYNHFGSKEAIFHALLREHMPYPRLIAALNEIPDNNGPQMLAEGFTRVQAIACEYVDFFALALTDMREFQGRTVRELVREMIPEYMRFLARAQAAGGLREDVPLPIFLRFIVSVTIGFLVTALVGYAGDEPLLPGLPTGSEARRHMMQLLLEGIAAPEGKR